MGDPVKGPLDDLVRSAGATMIARDGRWVAAHFGSRAGEVAALVMQKGPGRSRLNVLVDGVKKATLDSYAPSDSFRNVVWQTHLTAGPHTITVQNLATPGRPRIDLDGVLLN